MEDQLNSISLAHFGVMTEDDFKKLIRGERKKVIRCPHGMSEGAKKEWRRVAPALYDNGVLTLLDRTLLRGYCETYTHYIDTAEKLKEIEDPEEKKIYQEIAEDYKESARDLAKEYFLEFHE